MGKAHIGIPSLGEAVSGVGQQGVALQDVLLTEQHVEVVLRVLTEELLEVVAQRVGVTELAALLTCQCDSGLTLVDVCRDILHIISGRTVETVGIHVVGVVAELSLELQVLDDFPCEGSRHVQLGTLTLLVVVGD